MGIAQIIQSAPNALLAAQHALEKTDWTQLKNCGLTDDCIAEFVTYRAAILVIRKQSDLLSKKPSEFTWPDLPDEVWK
tara:strand:+ start:656 stop:889 length:234 start_codon:yes stop_codon:yes gene_type:complete